jgi:hypothetical protein
MPTRDPEQNPKDEATVVEPVGGGTLDTTHVYDAVSWS